MCGRYALAQEHEALRIRFSLIDEPVFTYRHMPRYNIAPTQMVAVITNGSGNRLRGMKWGLVPRWAKDPTIGNTLINARSETAAEKPSFRESLRKQRCLVPATGFYEWATKPSGKGKQPIYITMRDQGIFAFAGLWSSWTDPTEGKELLTFTILTTEPNDLMKQFHNRMPVILTPETEKVWLREDAEPAALQQLMAPCPSEILRAYPVSTLVNSPRQDSPDCLAPLPSLM